jgi:hypothetical protein
MVVQKKGAIGSLLVLRKYIFLVLLKTEKQQIALYWLAYKGWKRERKWKGTGNFCK